MTTLTQFINELLHTAEGTKNKLVDLYAASGANTYILTNKDYSVFSAYILDTITNRIGKPGNTVLRGSSLLTDEQTYGNINSVEWCCIDGTKDRVALNKFIDTIYKELSLKGNNPMFLSVGAIRWKTAVAREEVKEVLSPLLIFPIRLTRSTNNSPIAIEFINDDIYINPCLIVKMTQQLGEEINAFPHPNGDGVNLDTPIDLSNFSDGGMQYFAKLQQWVDAQTQNAAADNTLFKLERDTVAISLYSHDELCMYYDIRRNLDLVESHPLINRIFTENQHLLPPATNTAQAQFILPCDSTQQQMINRVVNGESLVVKGPPGTGKTLTIANMMASLLAADKKVLLVSQKITALTEVYAKLPDTLRDFVMLLESETESAAAKLNPSEIKRNFRELIRKRETYTPNNRMYDDLASAGNQYVSALNTVKKYLATTFYNGTILGGSYYTALDTYCKNTCEPVIFAEEQDVLALNYTQYTELCSTVVHAGKQFDMLTSNSAHTVERCPWYSVNNAYPENFNYDKAYSDYGEIGVRAGQVYADVTQMLQNVGLAAPDINLQSLYSIISTTLTTEQLVYIYDNRFDKRTKSVWEALQQYNKMLQNKSDNVSVAQYDGLTEDIKKFEKLHIDRDLQMSEITAVHKHIDLFTHLKDSTLALTFADCIRNIELQQRKIAQHKQNVEKVFRTNLDETQWAEIGKAYAKLQNYSENDTKPKMLDFGAKNAFNRLKEYCFATDVTFQEVVEAVKQWHAISDDLQLIYAQRSLMVRIFKQDFSDDVFDVLVKFGIKFAGSTNEIGPYVANIEEDYATLHELATHSEGSNYTVKQLAAAFDAALCSSALVSALKDFWAQKCEVPTNPVMAAALAEDVCSVCAFASNSVVSDMVPSEFGDLVNSLAVHDNVAREILSLKQLLQDFGKEHFVSFYAQWKDVQICDLPILANEVSDRNLINAATTFIQCTNNPDNALDLERFFRPFVSGVRSLKGYTFADIFEHSVYHLAIKAYCKLLGAERNGFGDRVEEALNTLTTSENKIHEAAVQVICHQCMSRLDPKDEDFAFLRAERDGGGTTLRKMFKQYARPILKIKKCFLMSPSTASVLMGTPDYNDFDVVIVDEASQVEPTYILPVLFRSKQCVLVGDEWQMPPIKHFTVREDRVSVDDDGDVVLLDPDMSVLGLALKNKAFDTVTLNCHYRSNTESLIAYSQKLFYPFMRTFPAAVPKAEGLGLFDCYVPNGFVENSVNHAEAVKVCEIFEQLFNKYYDEETGKLSQSIGIVAFGLKQLNHILSILRANKALSAKMDKALLNFDDLPEKLLFQKTIETVQGQEADHLILSLTYGKTSSGVKQSFGELNRGKLGQCIFNVAVTRAKQSVTLVRSVNPEEITNENVLYIRDYIMTVMRFAEDTSGFVSMPNSVGKHFINQVKEFIHSCGVPNDRIVVDCGATEGSLRVPIVVLSEDKSSAQLAVWCDRPVSNGESYLDINERYFNSMVQRGWKIYRLFAHDWVDNRQNEEAALKKALMQNLM